MRAIQVRCPQCGAGLDVDDDASSVTCKYCETSSRVQARSRVLQVPRPLPPDAGEARPVARQQVNRTAMVLPFVIALGVAGAITAMKMRSVTNIRVPGVGNVPVPGGEDRPDTWSSSMPVVVDADGDGSEDLVGLTRNVHDGDRAQVAAFAATDGKRMWQTARLGTYSDMGQAVLFAAGDVVVLATPSGELKAFDLKSGAPRWTVPLGERVREVCSDGEVGVVTVGSADDRWHRVALADGARSDRAAPQVLGRGADKKHQALAWVAAEQAPGTCLPVSRNDGDRPPGLATAASGSTMPTLEGMRLERLVRRGTGPVVAIGSKQPGTAVPTLAVLDGKKARWKAVIPAVDPLEARADGSHVTIGADGAYVVYDGKSGPRITGFALADGRRLWDQPLQKMQTIVVTGIMFAGGHVIVSTWGNLQAFDPATGVPAYLIGEL